MTQDPNAELSVISIGAKIRAKRSLLARKIFNRGLEKFVILAWFVLSSLILSGFLSVRDIEQWGYQMRLYFHLSPTWFWVHPQGELVLREELPFEFEGSKTDHILESAATAVAQEIKKFLEIQPKDVVLTAIVPNKTFANHLEVSPWQLTFNDYRSFGINPLTQESKARNSLSFIGSFSQSIQEKFESRLEQKGIPTLSLLKAYLSIPGRRYAKGDSHWTRSLVLLIGAKVITSLVDRGLIPKACFRDVSSEVVSASTSRTWWEGDLLKALFLSGVTQQRFATEDLGPWSVDEVLHLLNTKDSPGKDSLGKDSLGKDSPGKVTVGHDRNSLKCPPIVWVGTSFGAAYKNEGDISQSLQLSYKGKVFNASLPGKGPRVPFLEFRNQIIRDQSLRELPQSEGLQSEVFPRALSTQKSTLSSINNLTSKSKNSEPEANLGRLKFPQRIVIWEFPFRLIRSM